MSATDTYDNLFKILIIGDSGVGKSCLLLRFCDNEFNEKQLSTIGVDFKVKFMSINNKRVKLAIWDTAGQERFRTLTSSYYRGAHGIILVYDAGNQSSFDNLEFWLSEVKKYSTNPNAIRMLVANKVDASVQEVGRERGERFALENSMLFIETSAKTSKGVKQAFEELIYKILENPKLIENTTPLVSPKGRQSGRRGILDNLEHPSAVPPTCNC
jgi:Ras-related protein Rab-18